MKIRQLNSVAALLLICLTALTARAQIVSGTVTDAQNVPVERANVRLFAGKVQISQTQTDRDGKFSLAANNQKDLVLRVEAASFAVFEQRLTALEQSLTVRLLPQNLQESVTISVTGTETRLTETPASVIVINRTTLEETAAQTIDDALRQVSGFTLFRRTSSKTANPTTQGANLRGVGGSGAARTAVLFDGVSLNDAFGGWTYWNRIPRVAVEQIEVLRGGASSIYGNQALSGAINLLPNKNDSPVLRVETSGGTQNTADASVFAAANKNNWSFDLAAESFATRGYFPIAEETRGAIDARANSRHESGFLTIEKRFDLETRVFARGSLFKERRANGTNLQNNRTYFRQAVAGTDSNNSKFGNFAFRSSIEAEVYDQTFTAISADRNSENLTRSQRVPSQAVTANLFWTRSFAKNVLSSSFEIKRVNGFSDELVINNNRATSAVGAGGQQTFFGIFAQYFWRVNSKLNLNFGGRFDFWRNQRALSTTRNLINPQASVTVFPDKSEKSFSPQISALYQINQKLGATVSFNQSFRAPNLNELYRAFRVGNVLTLANENLRAERATNFESGLRAAFWRDKLNLRGTVFTTTVTRPVVSLTLSQTPSLITRQRQNLGATRSNGVELDFEVKARRNLTISGGYLLVDARIKDFPGDAGLVGNFLPQVARQQLTAQTFYRPEKYSIGLQGRISDLQFDDDQNQFRLRPFFTLDAFTSYRLLKKLEIFAAAENVFNQRYDIALTPNLNIGAPRSVRLGLRFSLGKN